MVTALADDIWWYDLTGVNATLVDDDGALTLVDTGLPWHGNELIAGLSNAGYELRDLDRILLTHFDLDHVGGLTAFDGIDVPIYVGKRDAPLVTGSGRRRWETTRVRSSDSSHRSSTRRTTTSSPWRRRYRREFHDLSHPRSHAGARLLVSESLSLGLLGDLVREDAPLRTFAVAVELRYRRRHPE